jgi:hypothetical protein
MAKSRYLDTRAWVVAVAAGITIMAGPITAPAWGQEAVDPEAARILKSMTDFLGAASTISASYDSEREILDRSGQKLQLLGSGKFQVERPGKLHAVRDGALASAEIFADGKTVTLYGKGANAYAQLEMPEESIDSAIDEFRMETGLDISGADLLYSNAYDGLMTDVESGQVIGTGYIQGKEAHHLAFRAKDVDWQIWVETGDKPLPLKYVITSKWITGAPQFSIVMSDWDVGQKMDPAIFVFAPPEGAVKLDGLVADETGEIAIEAPK